MAAAQHMDGPRPLPRRRESLQIMLDLEKQFKFARLQAQTPKGSMAPQPQVQPMPSSSSQARRREPSEAFFLQGQRHRSAIPTSVHRPGLAPPLSITIPSPTITVVDKEQKSDASQQPKQGDTATHEVEHPVLASGSQNVPLRDSKTDALDNPNGTPHNDANRAGADVAEDDNDDAKSVQSSICQSPSWEGYGQKKKDKKKKQILAEQQKRETEKPDHHEPQASAKKRLAKRLVKSPPSEKAETNGHQDHLPAMQPAGSGGPSAKSGRFTPSGTRSLIPEVWGLAVGTGRRSLTSRPSHSRSTSATTDEDNGKGKGKGKEKDNEPSRPPAAAEKTYPPLSSRSHALRHSLLPVQVRQNHPVSAQLEDLSRTHKDNYKLYTAKNLSDQSVDYAAKPMVRGRQRDESEAPGGYVSKTRAQSIERYIKGFMQEAAFSDPNLLNAPNRMAFSYLSPAAPQQTAQAQHRPGSSQSQSKTSSAMPTPIVGGPEKAAAINPGPAQDPDTMATPSSGILSMIKSRVSRRSSISSGSTSTTGKSFRERALSAMQMQSTGPSRATAPSPLPPQVSSQTLSHTSTASPAAAAPQAKEATTTTTTTTMERPNQAAPAVHLEAERLPKAARVLGEVNHETMSQSASSHKRPAEGSSTSSSSHDGFSVSASPASTPGTSRPQSAKCVPACIAEIKDSAPAKVPGSDASATSESSADGNPQRASTGSTETLEADHANKLSEGLGILHEAWSQSTVAADTDAQSFVTTLTNQKSVGSLRSQGGILNLKEAALLARQGTLDTHPAFRDEDASTSTKLEDRPTTHVRSLPPIVPPPTSHSIRTAKTETETVPRQQSPHALPPQTQTPKAKPKRKPLPPLAKMLVECCHCKFFHDMPSRVYECMAQPNAVVTDRSLGVSGAITTMVKCPWCAHNMSTQCCAGYAAVVYLKERLH